LVERHDLPPITPVATFFVDAELHAGGRAQLDASAAHHARVKRLVAGDIIAVTDGAGVRATASITELRKSSVECDVIRVELHARPPALHVRVPVADRDRMLWLAEKATEFGVTTWQSVRFRRSMSVSPRGEGSTFTAKLRLRMIAALEQSGGAWLPHLLPDADLRDVAPAASCSFVLDAGGPPLLGVFDPVTGREPIVLVGPEGGIEPDEMAILEGGGWHRARLASTTLRFETAGIGAIAAIRGAQLLTEI
jgi:16S rRNA (uracil1498-N3)-methyltransferase